MEPGVFIQDRFLPLVETPPRWQADTGLVSPPPDLGSAVTGNVDTEAGLRGAHCQFSHSLSAHSPRRFRSHLQARSNTRICLWDLMVRHTVSAHEWPVTAPVTVTE